MAKVISINGLPHRYSYRWSDIYGGGAVGILLQVAGKLRDDRRTVSAAASKRAATKRRNIRARSKK